MIVLRLVLPLWMFFILTFIVKVITSHSTSGMIVLAVHSITCSGFEGITTHVGVEIPTVFSLLAAMGTFDSISH